MTVSEFNPGGILHALLLETVTLGHRSHHRHPHERSARMQAKDADRLHSNYKPVVVTVVVIVIISIVVVTGSSCPPLPRSWGVPERIERSSQSRKVTQQFFCAVFFMREE